MASTPWIRNLVLCGAASALGAFSPVEGLGGGRAAAAEWHAAADGTPNGDGSEKAPWDIQTAAGGPAAVKPGDTIWLHGGTYLPKGQVVVKLQGETDKPIVLRNWKNERVTVNAHLDVGWSQNQVPTKYVWIWGIEIQSCGTPNQSPPMDIGNSTFAAGTNPGIKVINCVAHDCAGNGFGCWGSAEEEIYGCIIYYNGSDGDLANPAERGHGHGFYIQSKTHKEFRDNIVFRQCFLGFQIYGTSAPQFENITMEGNTFFNNGELSLIQMRLKDLPEIYVGAGRLINNPKLIDNCVYAPAWANKSTINVGKTVNALLKGNYFVSPGPDKRVALDLAALGPNTNLTMTDNTLIGLIAGFTIDQFGKGNVHIADRPTTGKKIFVRKNAYEEGRANITIFNWDKSDQAEVDVSAAGLKNGDKYEVRDVQNWFGKPVAAGRYDGKPVTIPMTGLTVAAPIGRPAEYKTPPHTAPEFGAFVIMRAAETKQ